MHISVPCQDRFISSVLHNDVMMQGSAASLLQLLVLSTVAMHVVGVLVWTAVMLVLMLHKLSSGHACLAWHT